MAFDKEARWLNANELGQVKVNKITYGDKDYFNENEKRDTVHCEFVDATGKHLCKANFYLTVKNRDIREAKDFMMIAEKLVSGERTGCVSGMKYDVSSKGNVFLIPTKNMKLV